MNLGWLKGVGWLIVVCGGEGAMRNDDGGDDDAVVVVVVVVVVDDINYSYQTQRPFTCLTYMEHDSS